MVFKQKSPPPKGRAIKVIYFIYARKSMPARMNAAEIAAEKGIVNNMPYNCAATPHLTGAHSL
jgi:hypothetical protein